MDNIMNLVFTFFKNQMIDKSGEVLNYLSKASIDLFSNSIVTNLLSLFNYMGYILLAVGILFAIANVYLEYLEGGCIEVHLTIINIFKSIIAIIFLQVGSIQVYDLSNTVNRLISQITSTPDYSSQINTISAVLNETGLGVVWMLIIMVVAVVSVIVCFVQIMKRGGMYMVQIITGYLYVFSIPSGNTDGFMEWCRQTVAIALTNVVQTALLFIGMSLMANDITKIFLGIGVILSATSVEKIAGRYGLSAGARQHIGSAIRSAGMVSSAASTVIQRIKG